ncbi:alpha/beta hydrolase [Salibacterium salarium]|uniref:Alpha/beta hydrolase n=1 Tax=Salibacterium salarium TaxID=284579 RepID=A0A3R9Q3T4_9BACI|nr:alpha/beta hydrolase [Salibacterium salarium]RSL33022.1 alpha/beta hydrolase [Salibacterium salarium]
MKHIFKEGKKDAPVLLLLHGTGGTEEDLLEVGKMIDEDASILSVRGNVTENGMPRYFRRLGEGVFDEEDLIFRTKELYEFIDESAEQYGFDRDNVVAVGYSNGANIAGSLLFHYKKSLKGALLHHPMVPRKGVEIPSLQGRGVFIGAGANDPICAPEETEELSKLLEEAGADVHVQWEHSGHQLTIEEVQGAAAYYEKHIK